ncbi:MAG: PilZ domain-containing protein [Syntrophaceae bacterium]|nr:PilZ domain-containing protein [Syntrophaceae bacterium]
MYEKRKAERLAEEGEVTITVVPGGKKFPQSRVIYNTSKDISISGAKIQSNIFLPVDTLLKISFKLKNLEEIINAMGKVKWIKIICEDECYDAGVEFVNTPKEAVQRLSDYISWKKKLKNTKQS